MKKMQDMGGFFVAAISTDEAIEYAKTAKALGYDAMISTVPSVSVRRY